MLLVEVQDEGIIIGQDSGLLSRGPLHKCWSLVIIHQRFIFLISRFIRCNGLVVMRLVSILNQNFTMFIHHVAVCPFSSLIVLLLFFILVCLFLVLYLYFFHLIFFYPCFVPVCLIVHPKFFLPLHFLISCFLPTTLVMLSPFLEPLLPSS